MFYNSLIDDLEKDINKFIKKIKSSGKKIIDVEIDIDKRVIPLNSYTSSLGQV